MPKFIPALCTLVALGGASALHAETMYAISYDANTLAYLFSFDSATPDVITTPGPSPG